MKKIFIKICDIFEILNMNLEINYIVLLTILLLMTTHGYYISIVTALALLNVCY